MTRLSCETANLPRDGERVKNRLMRVRIGCEFRYEASEPTPSIWQVRPRVDGPHELLVSSWTTTPYCATHSYFDRYGNLCDRLVLARGDTTIRFDARAVVPAHFDDADKGARHVPVEHVPDDVLLYLLPSRFCLSDSVVDQAWDRFGSIRPGWERVQGVCDWAHENIRYTVGSSTPITTSTDVLDSLCGVCRDYTHVGITFCRALNVPARYVSGYLPDIAVEPQDVPMDFCSWFEAYLDGRWWTFDPRNNVPRMGRVVIGRGRDAADVAMVTTYGSPSLRTMEVWADEIADSDGVVE